MVICPKCSNELADGAQFCNKCGSKIEAAANEPMVVTEEPAAAETPAATETPAAAYEAPTYGAADPLATDPNSGKNTKKVLLIGGIVVGVAAIAAIAIALILNGGSSKSKNNNTVYLRDDQIFVHTLGKKDVPFELSDDLNDDKNYSTSSVGSDISSFIYVSDSSDLIIYPDKIDGYENTLFYVHGLDEKAEPQKLADDVDSYYVSEDEKSIIYMTFDSDLYQTNFEEKDKLGSDVYDYYVSPDGKTVCWLTSDSDLYIQEIGGEKEKVDSDVDYIVEHSENLDTLIYRSEDKVYRYKKGEKEEKLISDASSVVAAYESGEIYYMVSEEHPMSDLVEDDMAAEDADIMDPDDLENPAYDLEYPDYDDYEDYDAYWDAYDAYWDEYYELDDAYWEEYYALWDAYDAKQERDWIREDLEEYTYTTYSLYYFNGTEEVLVAENVTDSYSYYAASDKAVVAFETVDAEISKLKLSEMDYYETSIWSLYDDMIEDGEINLQVAVGGTATVVETQDDQVSIEDMSEDGKTLLFIDNAEYDEVYDEYWDETTEEFVSGDLYKVTIGDTPGTPELVTEAVYSAYFNYDGKIVTSADVDDEDYTAVVSVDGTEIGEMRRHSMTWNEKTGEMLYFTDWDSEDQCGTLMLWKDGESTEIKDDVYEAQFTANGDIIYLYDYNVDKEKGDLYRYTGKDEDVLIDEDVQYLLNSADMSEQYRTYYYYEYDYDYDYDFDYDDYDYDFDYSY